MGSGRCCPLAEIDAGLSGLAGEVETIRVTIETSVGA